MMSLYVTISKSFVVQGFTLVSGILQCHAEIECYLSWVTA